MPVQPTSSTRIAFDREASDYLLTWERDPVARIQRRRVHDVLRDLLAPGSRVLDLGCGAGSDVAWLSRNGHRVTGVDASPGMLEQATRRCDGLDVTLAPGDIEHPDSLPAGPFDAILSNFGVLNCVDLTAVGPTLAARLVPGGLVIAVVMSAFYPLEAALLTLQGHPREAVRRRRRSTAPVGGASIRVRFLTPEDVGRGLAPSLTMTHHRALGVVLPPPGPTGARLHRLARFLDPLDDRVGRLPVLRRWGDHTLVVLRAAAAP